MRSSTTISICPLVQVQINGEATALADGSTVSDLVRQLGLSQRRIAIEINRAIVARETYDSQPLADGDEIEIVHFVGGG